MAWSELADCPHYSTPCRKETGPGDASLWKLESSLHWELHAKWAGVDCALWGQCLSEKHLYGQVMYSLYKAEPISGGVLFFFPFWLRRATCRTLVPRPLQWKHGVLTTGLPGKSLFEGVLDITYTRNPLNFHCAPQIPISTHKSQEPTHAKPKPLLCILYPLALLVTNYC